MSANILIVEDEMMLQNAYKLILEFKGYTIETANNGEEGLSKLKTFKPDLILLDMLMPRLDGLGFMQQADLAHTHPTAKVVLLSNFSNSARQSELKGLGVDAQFLKAEISPTQLTEIVVSHLGEVSPPSSDTSSAEAA